MRGLIFLMAATLSGCAIVTIEGATGPQRLLNIGSIEVIADQPNRAIVSTTYGIGATSQNGVLNVGYLEQNAIQILESTECHLILIIKNAEEAEQIRKALGVVLNEVCIKNNY